MSDELFTLTKKQADAIDNALESWGGDKQEILVCFLDPEIHCNIEFDEIRKLDLDTLCTYLYNPNRVEIEESVDEKLLRHYKTQLSWSRDFYDGREESNGQDYEKYAFMAGMETALKIIGRQVKGIITWEDEK